MHRGFHGHVPDPRWIHRERRSHQVQRRATCGRIRPKLVPWLPTPPTTSLARPPTSSSPRFFDGTLAATEWTHAAHLLVARHAVDGSPSTDAAVDLLRSAICAHNDRVGLRPGHGGYHETITRYFVDAVAHAGPGPTVALLREPSLQRDAPLAHWSRRLLATDEARTSWVGPDRAPLPWSTTPATT